MNLFTFIRKYKGAALDGLEEGTNSMEVVREARRVFRAISQEVGGGSNPYLLTAQESSAKLTHNAEFTDSMVQVVMYLAPHRLSGVLNVCPWSTAGCRSVCLHDSGRLGMSAGQTAMLARTLFLAREPRLFMAVLQYEIRLHNWKAKQEGKQLVVRLNGTSDIPWEQFVPDLFSYWEDYGVQFQDYTKDGMLRSGVEQRPDWSLPHNYYLVRSVTEVTPLDRIEGSVRNVVMVANVKRGDSLPETFLGKAVIDGDKHDLRVADPQGGRIVMVRAKGSAIRKDSKGFVRSV